MPLKDNNSESEDILSDIPESSDNFHVVPSGEEEEEEEELFDRIPKINVMNENNYIPEISDMINQQGRQQPSQPVVNFFTKILKTLLLPICKILFAPAAQRTFVKTTVLFVSISWIIVTSLIAYVMFYQQYIPPIMHVQPIWFNYQKAQGPTAIVNLIDSNKRHLRHEQVYDISVQLNVPTSDINFDIGNFMVQIQLYSKDGNVVLESSRPSILRYQSRTQRIMRVFAKAIPLLIGLSEESQVLNIKLVDDFMELKSQALNKVSVSISDPRIQIYDAKLFILANFKGLRYYMYFYRISAAVIFMCMFASIEFICAAIAWKTFGESMWYKLSQFIPEIEKQQQPVTFNANEDNESTPNILNSSTTNDTSSSDKSG
ncbi:putative adipose-regulatory protein-domain-containing protein [Cokeromyces recurvatus]|uniref:putative adipose-regulatory protein-domain-containing protein n=1 Tax=Cokeromyces recurvatus TaxID=90255 RepID=UPI00221EEA2C|nr:putative adipose-regulatory protein-domain-containing protein [Cokeromyces recurvatus]KAI7900841.1 putative adipose-regulatory protein-domain-containing protein [Cokeromyces recurvatus]